MMAKTTVKIPLGLLEVLKAESKRTGMGLQALAGQILVHGFNDIRAKQREESENVDTKDTDR